MNLPVAQAVLDRLLGGAGVIIFFSSRMRHTRFDCDWSSDVCPSDLQQVFHPRTPQRLEVQQVPRVFLSGPRAARTARENGHRQGAESILQAGRGATEAFDDEDREGGGSGKRGDLGGGRIIKKKK